jgi:lactoylglutathione lyase
LGLEIERSFQSVSENVDEDIVRLGRGPFAVELDLMQPIDASRSPRVHQPPLNHIGLWVDDLDAAYAWLSARGVRFAGGIRTGAAGHRVAFIHPKPSSEAPRSGQGVLIELIAAPPEIIEAFDSHIRAP